MPGRRPLRFAGNWGLSATGALGEIAHAWAADVIAGPAREPPTRLYRSPAVHLRSISPLAEPLLDRLLRLVDADERFVGVTLGGSAARGVADAHSDLDLVLACRDGDHDALMDERQALAASLGPLLVAFTGEHVGEPRLLIALYGPPLLHVDLKLVAQRDLADRVEDGVLLHERDAAIRTAWTVRPASWPQPDPQWIEDRFWVWIHYGATKLARGELFECLDVLAMLRSAVLGPLLARNAGQPRPQGVRRIEQIVPEAVEALAATVGDHTFAGCAAALAAAADMYVLAREASPPAHLRAAAQREAMAFLRAVRGQGAPSPGHPSA